MGAPSAQIGQDHTEGSSVRRETRQGTSLVFAVRRRQEAGADETTTSFSMEIQPSLQTLSRERCHQA